MKKIYTAVFTVLMFLIAGSWSHIAAQDTPGMIGVTNPEPTFFLAENGITVKCPDAQVGDTGVVTIDGVERTFTKRDRDALLALRNSQNMEEFANSCVSGETDFTSYFFMTNFNEDISHWDVSSATTMQQLFLMTPFNQNISAWDVSNVENMSSLFESTPFNQDISAWDVSNVEDMNSMFQGASAFNQDLSGWCVSNIETEPTNFANNSGLAAVNFPVWGTCPAPALAGPIEITDWAGLHDMRNDLSAHYVLMNDLNENSPGYADFVMDADGNLVNDGKGWEPIGGDGNPFSGTLDGQNHTISGIVIEREGDSFIGFFGLVSDATIKNLGLVNVDITARSTVGGMAGQAEQSTFTDVHVIGNVTASSNYAGGLVGHMFDSNVVQGAYTEGSVVGEAEAGGLIGRTAGGQESGNTISDSHSESDVQGSMQDNFLHRYFGGLIGSNAFADITNSYATGSVQGNTGVGGLVGINWEVSFIRDSHATGAVQGYERVGGLVGSNQGTIEQVYATGDATGLEDQDRDPGSSASEIGGLVGENRGSIEHASATGDVSGLRSSGGLVGNNNGDGAYIKSSWATGNVTGMGYNGQGSGVGGLVGSNSTLIAHAFATGDVTGIVSVGGLAGSNFGEIENAYAIGSVTGDNFIGGLTGFNLSNIVNAYATGSVTATGDGEQIGGLVGGNVFQGQNQQGTAVNSFWDTETTGQDSSDGGEGKTTAQMKTMATFTDAGWDLQTLTGQAQEPDWYLLDENTGFISYPFLSAIQYDEPELEAEQDNPIPGLGLLTDDSPIEITDWTELHAVRDDLSAHYVLMNDLDENSPGYADFVKDEAGDLANDGKGWEPIGTFNARFEGTFDGQGHTISGLVIDRSEDFVGLFGFAQNATIQGVGLLSVDIVGGVDVGALVGSSGNGTNIASAFAEGTVKGTETSEFGSGVGGLIGRNLAASVHNSYFVGNVSGIGEVGGLVGSNENQGEITTSYASGSVTGGNEFGSVGGLVGGSVSNTTIKNSYATSDVTGEGNVMSIGGLVGFLTSTIDNAYATGNVSGPASDIGGLVGFNQDGSVENSFWDTETTKQNSSDGGEGKTTEEMFDATTFTNAGWSTDEWTFAQGRGAAAEGYEVGKGLPYLTDVTREQDIIGEFGTLFAGGWGGQTEGDQDGADGSAYAIEDWNQLQNMNQVLGQPFEFVLANSLDSDTEGYAGQVRIDENTLANDGKGWEPIGSSFGSAFTGTFNGQNHTISDLVIDRGNEINVGLFGYVRDGTVQDLKLVNIQVTGGTNVGGLAGKSREQDSSSTLVNIHVEGDVTGKAVQGEGFRFTGGLIGWNRGTIENTSFSGNVSGLNVAGGLAGYNTETITNSNASANVTVPDEDQFGAKIVGGLAGWNEGTVKKAYATGDVTGSGDSQELAMGGLVGLNGGFDQNEAKIEHAFATGSVIGEVNLGGLVGVNQSNGIITNAYATGSVTGIVGGGLGTFGTGGLVGLNEGDITNTYATGSVTRGQGATGSYGGLVGNNTGTGSVENSFWDTETTTQNESAGGEGKSTAQLKTMATFTDAGWDLETRADQTEEPVWYLLAESTGFISYPFLSALQYDEPDLDAQQENPIPGLELLLPDIHFALQSAVIAQVQQRKIAGDSGVTGVLEEENEPSNIYHPSPGGGVVPQALQQDYAQSTGAPVGELAEGDWSYEAHQARFQVVPKALQQAGNELFSVRLALVFDSEAALAGEVRPGALLSGGDNVPAEQAIIFVNDAHPDSVLIDIASTSGNLSLIDNELSLIEFDMEILRAGYNEIRVDVIEARRKLEDTAGGPEVITELLDGTGDTGAIRLWPGDFAADGNGIRGTIGFTDLTAFSSAYFAEVGHEAYRLRFDIGNADNRLYTALPVADGRIGFDDLNIFALGFGLSNRQDSPLLRQTAGPQSGEAIDLIVEAPRVQGGLVRYPVYVDGSVHDVRTMSLNLSYTGMTFRGHEVDGALDTEMTFSASRSTGGLIEWDSAIIGTQNASIGQAGRIGYLVFEADRPGALAVQSVRARDSQGEPIDTRPVDAAREDQALVPELFALQQNYPNPFNPSTTIAYDLPVSAEVILQVYDAMGRKVATLANGQQPAGSHQVSFDASRLASGVYIYRLQAGEFTQTRQMMLVK